MQRCLGGRVSAGGTPTHAWDQTLPSTSCPPNVVGTLYESTERPGRMRVSPAPPRAAMLTERARAWCQFTMSVCDSIGAAESYRVSVSCVGSPCSWHWLLRVPAPQSQKNLQPQSVSTQRSMSTHLQTEVSFHRWLVFYGTIFHTICANVTQI